MVDCNKVKHIDDTILIYMKKRINMYEVFSWINDMNTRIFTLYALLIVACIKGLAIIYVLLSLSFPVLI